MVKSDGERRIKITRRTLDALKPTDPKGERVYDADLGGFCVTAYPPSPRHPKGQKVFGLRYGHGRKRKWLKIGVYSPDLTVEKARAIADRERSKFIGGADPAAEREAREAAPTFKEWVATYCQEAGASLSPKWLYEVKRYLEAAPFQKKRLEEVTVEDARRFYTLMRKRGDVTANRALASLKACLSYAVTEGRITSNPAAGKGRVKVVKETGRGSRFLKDEELSRFFATLDKWPDPMVAAAFRLMAITGLRRSEMLRARWSDVDFKEGSWNLPKTKAGEEQSIPLTDDVRTALQKLPRIVGCAFIIPGKTKRNKDGSSLVLQRKTLHTAWRAVCKAAEIKGATPHDLRRGYGRLVLKATGNIVLVQKILRHSDIRVTQRIYSPLTQDDTRQAAEAASVERRNRLKVVSGGAAENAS